jgi:hypothetical protein
MYSAPTRPKGGVAISGSIATAYYFLHFLVILPLLERDRSGPSTGASCSVAISVYKQLCSACHSMNLMSYRNLGQPGGPEFSEAEVQAIAGNRQVTDGPDDSGEMFERPAWRPTASSRRSPTSRRRAPPMPGSRRLTCR